MIEIQSPNPIPASHDLKIFLAGSIEKDTAEEWQDHVVTELQGESGIIFNPRRDDWNNTWKQTEDDPQFKQQVEWELDALAASDKIIMYFDPHTKSPISLLEFGLYAQSGKLLVVCPDGFWRKGNVDIVCEKYGIPQFADIESLIAYVKEKVAV